MQTLLTARESFEERMRKFDGWVKMFGYRPPTKTDLVPGAEMIMVDVERYMERHNQGIDVGVICNTRIKLDTEPLAPSRRDPSTEIVCYHCVMPPWDGQCFIPIDDFCASGYVEGCYTNDTRYVIKA